jgi:hypothetical protein
MFSFLVWQKMMAAAQAFFCKIPVIGAKILRSVEKISTSPSRR